MYEFGGYSDIEVDNVDLKKYPKMRNVEYARVILDKGDCIYMPSGIHSFIIGLFFKDTGHY